MTVPPTIVVVHPKENRGKCTVEPLREREGFRFHTWGKPIADDLTGYVRLAVEGTPLGAADRENGLLVLDATWRHAQAMEADFASIPPRSLPAVQTAYPRVSKWFADPPGGLATIEAIHVAYAILGRDTAHLLDRYHWRDAFLERNAAMLDALRSTTPAGPSADPR